MHVKLPLTNHCYDHLNGSIGTLTNPLYCARLGLYEAARSLRGGNLVPGEGQVRLGSSAIGEV